MEAEQPKLISVSVKSFAGALAMLLALMIVAYVLTGILPAGVYDRVQTDGREAIVADTYHPVEGGISFWKWLFSPILALTASGGGTALAIIVFLLIVGGAFTALDACGLLSYMLSRIYHRFAERKYMLLPLISLFFMALGSFVGSFEECIPMVPLVVALAYSMGWDALTGLGMSLLAVGFGFSTGVCNPFTVGVAQKLCNLPMFSGMSMRLLSFGLIYGLLMAFLLPYAKRVERDPRRSIVYDEALALKWSSVRQELRRDHGFDKGLRWFAGIIFSGVVLILCSGFIPALQNLIMPLIAVVFLAAGTVGPLMTGMPGKTFLSKFGKGAVSFLPAVLLILMANSIQYTLSQAHILDTILYQAVRLTANMPDFAVVLMIYGLVLGMNLFIGSGSAKAFLLIPLIAPLADLTGISRQLAVLAFIYGDGFSNVFYPTNPALLVALSIVGIGYGKWARWSIKIQAAILAVTCGLLFIGFSVGY